MRPYQFKQWRVSTGVGSIAVVGVQAHNALLHYVCDLKASQMYLKHGIIQELMLFLTEPKCCGNKYKDLFCER